MGVPAQGNHGRHRLWLPKALGSKMLGSSSGSRHSTGSPSSVEPILWCPQQRTVVAPVRVWQQRPSVQLDTKTTPKAQCTLGSFSRWNPKSGDVLCLCWECWAAWERTWRCTPSHEPLLNWGQAQLFPLCPACSMARQRCSGCHVLERLCQGSRAWRGRGYSWLPADVWPKRALGFGGLLVLAGCNFSKGYFQAVGLRSKQLPVSVPGSAGGL